MDLRGSREGGVIVNCQLLRSQCLPMPPLAAVVVDGDDSGRRGAPRGYSCGAQGRATSGVGAGFPQFSRYMGYAGADCRRAAGTGAKGNRPQNDGHCFKALLSTWPRGFPEGVAIGHAQAADERAEVAQGKSFGGHRATGHPEKGQGATGGTAQENLTCKRRVRPRWAVGQPGHPEGTPAV